MLAHVVNLTKTTWSQVLDDLVYGAWGVNQVWVVFNLMIVIFISPWNWLADHLWPLALKLSTGEASNLIHERQKDSHSC